MSQLRYYSANLPEASSSFFSPIHKGVVLKLETQSNFLDIYYSHSTSQTHYMTLILPYRCQEKLNRIGTVPLTLLPKGHLNASYNSIQCNLPRQHFFYCS
jgi:hypothetical protein